MMRHESCFKQNELPLLEFPLMSGAWKRIKREWVIPAINFPENHRGPYPQFLVKVTAIRSNKLKPVFLDIYASSALTEVPVLPCFRLSQATKPRWPSPTRSVDRGPTSPLRVFSLLIGDLGYCTRPSHLTGRRRLNTK